MAIIWRWSFQSGSSQQLTFNGLQLNKSGFYFRLTGNIANNNMIHR